jgi:hypothetical protein
MGARDNVVFLLWFVEDEDQNDNGLLIGAYESELAAKEAIERLRSKPGFVDNPKGFQVHVRQLGQDSWTEGFVRD